MTSRRIELDLAFAGLALARNWLIGDRPTVERALDEVRRLAAVVDDRTVDAPERDVVAGYDAWAATYDPPSNPIIQLEQPKVREILAKVPPGVALDAACGTGRHAAFLEELGHHVIAVDVSEGMLAKARERLTNADVRPGALTDLPVDSDSVDAAVCALALTHLPELVAAVRELARVVRPGGSVVISDVHPVFVALGAQAAFGGGDGGGFIRNHVHWPGTYLAAFKDAGLSVDVCHDLPYGRRQIDIWANSMLLEREVVNEAIEGLPAVLVWELRRRGD
jgi:ubiquinone/menaquinone biosynthesis C-methylase UbiE